VLHEVVSVGFAAATWMVRHLLERIWPAFGPHLIPARTVFGRLLDRICPPIGQHLAPSSTCSHPSWTAFGPLLNRVWHPLGPFLAPF
jgi:hypothetical protein